MDRCEHESNRIPSQSGWLLPDVARLSSTVRGGLRHIEPLGAFRLCLTLRRMSGVPPTALFLWGVSLHALVGFRPVDEDALRRLSIAPPVNSAFQIRPPCGGAQGIREPETRIRIAQNGGVSRSLLRDLLKMRGGGPISPAWSDFCSDFRSFYPTDLP